MAATSDLCAGCGLCCDGSLYGWVAVEPAEVERLARHRLPLVPRASGQMSLRQPCPAHRGDACAVYAERPGVCARFECALLKAVAAGSLAPGDGGAHARDVRGAIERLRASVGPLPEGRWLYAEAARIASEPSDPRRVPIGLDLGVALMLVRRHIDRTFGTGKRALGPGPREDGS